MEPEFTCQSQEAARGRTEAPAAPHLASLPSGPHQGHFSSKFQTALREKMGTRELTVSSNTHKFYSPDPRCILVRKRMKFMNLIFK